MVDVVVTDAGAGGGKYKFSCTGDYVAPNCDLDFQPVKGSVRINFKIAAGSSPGIKFAATGREAMWIVDSAIVGAGVEPKAPYDGSVFSNLAVLDGGKRLQVINQNNDKKTYQYALRFDAPLQKTEDAGAPPKQLAALDPAVVTGDQRSVSYTDLESDENVYEYSVALDGPNGRVVMDPTVKNGGGVGT